VSSRHTPLTVSSARLGKQLRRRASRLAQASSSSAMQSSRAFFLQAPAREVPNISRAQCLQASRAGAGRSRGGRPCAADRQEGKPMLHRRGLLRPSWCVSARPKGSLAAPGLRLVPGV
jgi:hypothetical protein